MGATEGPSRDPEGAVRGDGYSLVEVLVAIAILSVAILPMVGMFDAALRAGTLGGNYDKARALANEKLEEVRALPYSDPGGVADSVTERYPPATPESGKRGIFTYIVQTRFVDASFSNLTDSGPTAQMWVEVEVEWQGKSYTTTGFVTGA